MSLILPICWTVPFQNQSNKLNRKQWREKILESIICDKDSDMILSIFTFRMNWSAIETFYRRNLIQNFEIQRNQPIKIFVKNNHLRTKFELSWTY